jgi:uncharacterized membrane protein HdeD (DUF308 family)
MVTVSLVFTVVYLVMGVSCLASAFGVLPHRWMLVLEGVGCLVLALMHYLNPSH